MNQAKTSSKINSIFRAVATAAVLPVLFIYIMVAKPDYKIMNMLSYIVLPVAEFVGDVVTWPLRAVGNLIEIFLKHLICGLKMKNYVQN